MRQNITLAIDKQLLKKARAFAAQRGTSISAMLADELQKAVARETEYQQAKAKALAQLSAPFRLGGGKMSRRETLHDRQNLR
jgi:post-segregation antitoxin (ccd killing protein)